MAMGVRALGAVAAATIAALAWSGAARAEFTHCAETALFVRGGPAVDTRIWSDARIWLAQSAVAGPSAFAGVWCGQMRYVEDVDVTYLLELRIPESGLGELEVLYFVSPENPQRVLQDVEIVPLENGGVRLVGQNVRPLEGMGVYYPDTFDCTVNAEISRLECAAGDTAGDRGQGAFDLVAD